MKPYVPINKERHIFSSSFHQDPTHQTQDFRTFKKNHFFLIFFYKSYHSFYNSPFYFCSIIACVFFYQRCVLHRGRSVWIRLAQFYLSPYNPHFDSNSLLALFRQKDRITKKNNKTKQFKDKMTKRQRPKRENSSVI